MTLVNLRPIDEYKQECIGIFFSKDSRVEWAIRTIRNVKWSQVRKCWWLPMEAVSYQAIKKALEGIAALDTTELERYLSIRKKLMGTRPEESKPAVPGRQFQTVKVLQLTEPNLQALEKFIEQLKLRSYSLSSIRTYRNEFVQLLKLLRNKPVNELTVEDLRRYFVYCYEKLRLTEHTLHSRINAVKFYFEQVLKREKFFWDIPRPKKPSELPRTFNQDEIAAIINGINNKKHKTMVMLAYSAGLRVSEVVNLMVNQVDSKRMTILVRRGKGKKDRMVVLSPVLLVMLREYVKEYRPDRNGYLFEGNRKGSPYSARSLQEVLQAAKERAGIIKPGSIHSLRHSFATHLIDKGTDVTMIQKLLGHNDIRTTLRYLHTSNRDLLRIISPLDGLDLT